MSPTSIAPCHLKDMSRINHGHAMSEALKTIHNTSILFDKKKTRRNL